MRITQEHFSNEMGVGQPTISNWLRLADISRKSDQYALLTACISVLFDAGMSGPDAASIVGECSGEIRWLDREKGRTCWAVVHRSKSQILSLSRTERVEGVQFFLRGTPLAQVVALHAVVSRAHERLLRMEANNA